MVGSYRYMDGCFMSRIIDHYKLIPIALRVIHSLVASLVACNSFVYVLQ